MVVDKRIVIDQIDDGLLGGVFIHGVEYGVVFVVESRHWFVDLDLKLKLIFEAHSK